MMVVITERQALLLEACRHPAEFPAERSPALGVHVALVRRNGGHEEVGEAERPAGVGDGVRLLAERRKTDVARGRFQTSRVELRAHAPGVVEMRSDSFHMAVAR